MEGNESPEQLSLGRIEGAMERVSELDALPAKLGFIETDELRTIRRRVLEAGVRHDTEGIQEAVQRYRLLGEETVGQLRGSEYTRGQIGLNVAIGLLWRDAGSPEKYAEDTEDALEYADNMGYVEISSVLKANRLRP